MADASKVTGSNILTEDDIRNLIKSPFETRMDITKKIACYYGAGGFEKGQMKIAEDIFRTLLKDTEVEIRKTLSEAIKTCDSIPKDVVVQLAKDVNEVSLPVLEFSEVLSDKDLVEIITTTEDISKQMGVSKRKKVSEAVSQALIETGNENVVDTLLQNKNAQVSEKGYDKIVKDFSNKEKVMESVVTRENLPVNVVETMTKLVSEEIYKKLATKHKDAIDKISDVVKKSEDVTTMKVMGMQTSEQEYHQFTQLMKKLHIADELMPISALCVGNFNLFEICMARITKVPVLNIRTLLMDESNKGFSVLYERAGLPKNLYQATEVLLEVLRELKDKIKGSGTKLSKQSANRILGNLTMRVEERGEVENIDYIVTLIKHNISAE
ncbi:MAG: hypothetical protein K0R98_51 [Rickettsiaceae bacterium]|jgi:uncharacterized protein (DUF2336 family)|nr:hypothetical protein [Rickettsiaceae bacterium]